MSQITAFFYITWAVVLVLALLTILSGFFTVDTQTAAIVQRFGRFIRIAGPGLNFKTPWIESVAAKLDLRVQQHDVQVETKTKDNVFVKIPVASSQVAGRSRRRTKRELRTTDGLCNHL